MIATFACDKSIRVRSDARTVDLSGLLGQLKRAFDIAGVVETIGLEPQRLRD